MICTRDDEHLRPFHIVVPPPPRFPTSRSPRPFYSGLRRDKLVGSFSNDGDDFEDDARLVKNEYITSEIRDCLDLFGLPMALKTCSS